MPVCLHCGELATEGTLFCSKCGFTLPQGNGAPARAVGLPPQGAVAYPAVPAPVLPPRIALASPATGSPYLSLAPPGSTGPIAPPPVGKYCVRCRTIIARPAVYCPVCQAPQT